MIPLILFLAGIVGLSINEQFHGQYPIAFVLIVLGVLLFLVQLVLFLRITRAARESYKRVSNRHAQMRSRRGF